jgi:hypothetical protein
MSRQRSGINTTNLVRDVNMSDLTGCEYVYGINHCIVGNVNRQQSAVMLVFNHPNCFYFSFYKKDRNYYIGT